MLLLTPLTMLLLSYAGLSSAASLTVTIPPSAYLPNPNTLSSSTHALLTSGISSSISSTAQLPPLRVSLRTDNTIYFEHIPSTGPHILSIYSPTHTFAFYRIDIASSQSSHSSDSTNNLITLIAETYPGSPFHQHGPHLLPSQAGSTATNPSIPTISAHLTAKCTSAKDPYDPRPTLSLLSLLKNPMILLGGVALLFTVGMPKLLDSMDPETKAEFEEIQKQGIAGRMGKAMSGGGLTLPEGRGGGGGDVRGGSGGAGGAQAAQSLADFDLAGWMAGRGAGGGS